MKQYTQEEFDSFEVISGRKQCPPGDYSLIKIFPACCSFGESCDFGEGCSFDENCHFGEYCHFGEECSFGESCDFGEICGFGELCNFGECCRFGESCRFGECCGFGKNCDFGETCRFGESCSFSERCRFGESCSFSERCRFSESCTYCLFEFNELINLNGLYRLPIRIYLNTNKKEYYFSIGCEDFASIDELREESKKRNENNANKIRLLEEITEEALR